MTARAKPPQPRRRGETETKQKLRLWLRLLRATRSIEAALRERLRIEFATTMLRFDVMAALARHPRGMTMTALSRHLLVSNGNVTGIVDRLVVDGLVVRMSDRNDRRTTFVRLTHDGASRFAVMAAAHEIWVGELLADVSLDDAALIMAVLDRHGAAQATTAT